MHWTAFFLAGAIFVSCSSDDEDTAEPEVKKSFTYDEKEYELKSGVINDYGDVDPLYSYEPTHFNYDFSITDGEYIFTEKSENSDYDYFELKNASVEVYFELFYPSISTFEAGTFEFISEEEITVDKIKNKAFFSHVEVWFDDNGNRKRDEIEDRWIDAVGGTVTIAGSGKNYTLVYELQLENGKTLQGEFTGEFKYLKD